MPSFKGGEEACDLWVSTYCRTMSKGAPPHDAAKYDGDHNTPLKERPATSGLASRRRLDTPLRLLTSFDSWTK